MSHTKKNQSPLLFQLVLQGNGLAIADTEKATAQSAGVKWIHGDLAAENFRPWLDTLAIPDTASETLARTETRPRVWTNEKGVLLILRVLNMNPGQKQADMVSLRMWIEKNRLISVRQSRVFTVQDIHEELLAGNGPLSLQELVVSLTERVTDRIAGYVDELELSVEEFEGKIEALDAAQARRELSDLRRQAAMIRRYLAPQREALEKFTLTATQIMDAHHLYLMQELADRTIRYVEDLDLVREQTQVLLDELINRISQEQNSRTYVLSIIAAIFLPISFVTGMFGMNVGGLPGIENSAGFLLVCLGMGAISIGTIVWLRRSKWL